MPYNQDPTGLPSREPEPAPERGKSQRAVIWLLSVLVIGVIAVAALLVVQLVQNSRAEDAAQARHEEQLANHQEQVDRWSAMDVADREIVNGLRWQHNKSIERMDVAYERAEELRERCSAGEEVAMEWIIELARAVAHAERAHEMGTAAMEGAYATLQLGEADYMSITMSDNLDGWAAERARLEVLMNTPLASIC